jgi:hypothetical protein
MNPDGTQGAALGSGVCIAWSAYPIDLSAIPAACMMWMPGVDGTSPADLQGVYLTKQFQLGGAPIAGTIFVAVDDFATVIVNGHVVGSTGSVTDYSLASAAQSALREFALLPHLVSGQNTITVMAQNGPSSFSGGKCGPCNYVGNPAGVIFGGSLSWDAPIPVHASTWGRVKVRYR